MEYISFGELSVRFGSGLKPVLSPYVAGLLTISLDMKRRKRDIYVKDMNSKESSLRLEGTKKLARLLEADPRIGDLRPEDVRVLIGFLKHRVNPELQFFALFVLTNVDANGCELIVAEALPLLMQLMKSKHIHTQMQVLITLGRVTYDFPIVTGYLLRNGTLKFLHNIVVTNKYDDMMLRNCSTFLAIVCRELHYHCLQQRERAIILRIVKFLLQCGQGYDGVQSQAIAAISFLLRRGTIILPHRRRGSVGLGRKACTFYLGLISDADPLIVVSVLQVIVEIFKWCQVGTIPMEPQMMWMLEGGLLQRLYSLSHRKYKVVRFQVCLILKMIVGSFGKDEIWCHNGVFRIVKNEKMPKVFSVIKDLVTGQQIDFAEPEDNFLKVYSGYELLSIGPFSFGCKDVSFSKLRWLSEFRTQKRFLYWD